MDLVSAVELLSGTHQTLGCETQLCVHMVLVGASSLQGPGLALPGVSCGAFKSTVLSSVQVNCSWTADN